MDSSQNHRNPFRLPGLALPLVAVLSGCITLQQPAVPPNTIFADSPRNIAPSTETPVSANFKTSTQLKLQAAQHWANIATDTGNAIAELMRKTRSCGPQVKRCTGIYVNPPAVVTEFSRAFHNQLITTLVASGLVVSKVAEGSMSIDIDVQPVVFMANRPQYRFAGTATELGPGVWALRDAVSVKPDDPKAAPPTKDALHWFRTEFAAGQTPQTEIIVTVSAGDESRYLARATNVYYITDGDRKLYEQEICSKLSVCPGTTGEAGKVAVKPAPVLVRLDVTGDCPLDKKCCSPDKPCPPDGIPAAAPAKKTSKTTAKKAAAK